MNEKNLIRTYPVPVDSETLDRLSARVESRYRTHRRIVVTGRLLGSTVLIAVLAFLLWTPGSTAPAPQIASIEAPASGWIGPADSPAPPLLSSTSPSTESPDQNVAAGSASTNEVLDPVDFDIARTDGSIALVWKAEPGVDYVVKKCTLGQKGFDCLDEAKVEGNAYREPVSDTKDLIIYRVFAQRS
ncbi:MAG TPA: hypothetical protein PK014_00040 [Thermoanaerobaculia bacterium]|nr:hypothetical protein [Thermoanaerobaculia bacterium]HXK69103.1 hypothetical protein [Thermoanaerobaculia bacterium]